MALTPTTILILLLIGLFGGILSGFVGIGGGVIIVPSLVFFLGLTQHQAQGTSLLVLVLPVVGLALLNYWKTNNVNLSFGLIIAGAFVVGGYFGSKISLKMSPGIVKLIFGIVMAYVAIQLIVTGIKTLNQDG
jgi:uncharacterized membrane protein YfcA